jgi:hypothetical protein
MNNGRLQFANQHMGVGILNSTSDRTRALKVAGGLAAMSGGTLALMNLKGAKPVQQVALGALGGLLLAAGVIATYDGAVPAQSV